MQRQLANQNENHLQTNFGAVTAVIVRKRKGGNNLISVTFVEIQLGSGGVLCVAQSTAQSHGQEGEDQRVSAHQLHLGFCYLLFVAGACAKTSQTTNSPQYTHSKQTATHGE